MKYGRKKLNQRKKTVFEVVVNDDNYKDLIDGIGIVSYDWSIVYYQDSMLIDLMDNSDTSSFITKYDKYLVVDISKDTQKLMKKDIKYGIQVTVTLSTPDSSTLVNGYAEDIIRVHPDPYGGNCYLSHTNNILALTTLVTLTCQNWTDSDGSLTYELEVDNGVFIVYTFS